MQKNKYFQYLNDDFEPSTVKLRSFNWGSITQKGRDGYTFVTGSIPAYNTLGPVEVVTGYPN